MILPLTPGLIFRRRFTFYSSFKYQLITVPGVALLAPAGGVVPLGLTGTPFWVSSGFGLLAWFGLSVQTADVYISYVNELRRSGVSVNDVMPRARYFACARSC